MNKNYSLLSVSVHGGRVNGFTDFFFFGNDTVALMEFHVTLVRSGLIIEKEEWMVLECLAKNRFNNRKTQFQLV